MKRNAFTLTEVVIAICILGIMAASMTLNPNSAEHTAKSEAERIVTQLYRLIETANRTHVSFKVLFDGNEQTESVPVEWQTSSTSQTYHIDYDRELKLTKGCSIKNINRSVNDSKSMVSVGDDTLNLVYSIGDNGFLHSGMTLKVTGTDKSEYYIIIYVPGARIRISDTRP